MLSDVLPAAEIPDAVKEKGFASVPSWQWEPRQARLASSALVLAGVDSLLNPVCTPAKQAEVLKGLRTNYAAHLSLVEKQRGLRRVTICHAKGPRPCSLFIAAASSSEVKRSFGVCTSKDSFLP